KEEREERERGKRKEERRRGEERERREEEERRRKRRERGEDAICITVTFQQSFVFYMEQHLIFNRSDFYRSMDTGY
ncbi:capping protein inhibiting regulator of actin dynamics-like, partial [Protopterus annectens]|uniref:capping protein inhibiting regulator of actin dynamics-like n=1 Tax=Protopterus annectens TaxID=7888 RepID=UPI001CFB3469